MSPECCISHLERTSLRIPFSHVITWCRFRSGWATVEERGVWEQQRQSISAFSATGGDRERKEKLTGMRQASMASREIPFKVLHFAPPNVLHVEPAIRACKNPFVSFLVLSFFSEQMFVLADNIGLQVHGASSNFSRHGLRLHDNGKRNFLRIMSFPGCTEQFEHPYVLGLVCFRLQILMRKLSGRRSLKNLLWL